MRTEFREDECSCSRGCNYRLTVFVCGKRCYMSRVIESKAGGLPVNIPDPSMKQEAPYPGVLAALVERLEYRKGWRFRLVHHDRGQRSIGLTLIITTQGYDSYNPDNGETYRVNHFMPVPPAAYNEQSWRRWLLNQCLAVETH